MPVVVKLIIFLKNEGHNEKMKEIGEGKKGIKSRNWHVILRWPRKEKFILD